MSYCLQQALQCCALTVKESVAIDNIIYCELRVSKRYYLFMLVCIMPMTWKQWHLLWSMWELLYFYSCSYVYAWHVYLLYLHSYGVLRDSLAIDLQKWACIAQSMHVQNRCITDNWVSCMLVLNILGVL